MRFTRETTISQTAKTFETEKNVCQQTEIKLGYRTR